MLKVKIWEVEENAKFKETVNCNKDRDLLQSDLERLVEWLTSK